MFSSQCTQFFVSSRAAGYLAKQVFDSLQTMFTGAREIQDWYMALSDFIQSNGQSLVLKGKLVQF